MDDRRVRRFIDGISSRESPQSRDSAQGDPQLLAIRQYLATRQDLKFDDLVVDLGSGTGLLAFEMERVWKSEAARPYYVAVDLEDQLNALPLPISIHNHSKKIDFDSFLSSEILTLCDQVKLVVIRNVLHELDIDTTSKTLWKLASALKPETSIYIQDMVNLPVPERGNVGWQPQLLEQLLEFSGFEVILIEELSRGGTQWFIALCRPPRGIETSQRDLAKECARLREAQKREMVLRYEELKDDYDETSSEFMELTHEIAALDHQIAAFHNSRNDLDGYPLSLVLPSYEIPLRPTVGPVGHRLTSDGDHAVAQTGMVAIFRDKSVLDIPQLIKHSREHIVFSGYSQRKTFSLAESVAAIVHAVGRGCKFSALITDPDSEIVRLRSQDPAYVDDNQLRATIEQSIDAANEIVNAYAELRLAYADGRFDVRKTAIIPTCSFFSIDQCTFVSLYSRNLSGSSGPCLVFQPAISGSGYYEMLLHEFAGIFAKATSVLGVKA